jgi:ABC-type lipoprotein export system ATPase subunit
MIALKLQNLSKYYTSQNAVVMGLADVNLSFSIGEFVAVTGENGSGKSTLANVIGGILPYESGELYVMGQPTSHYDAADWERYRRDLISFISQDYGILPGNTVFENVESALVLSGTDRQAAKEKTREILRKVELSPYSKKRASKLSSGQKQRLAIARALAKPSKILIADEPTGNLDRENSDKVIRLLKEASEERLVVLITHEFDEAKDYITRHIILSDGKVVKDEECAQYTAPSDEEDKPARRSVGTSSFRLAPYVARLTAKTRPVFFMILTLILLLTSVASFVFVGNFFISLDDKTSRAYDTSAFLNGDNLRIVLAKTDLTDFTDEELSEIGKVSNVTSVEKFGYISDVNYYYRLNVDYSLFKVAVYLPEYDPIFNTDAWYYDTSVNLLFKDPLFLKSETQASFIREGRAPEGFYEVLSADPNYKVGSQVVVYVCDRQHWSPSSLLKITFDVVGEVSGGKGLYFSEEFCKMMNNATLNAIINSRNMYVPGGDLGKNPVAPYDLERYNDSFVVYPSPSPTPDPAFPKPSQMEEPTPSPSPRPEMIDDDAYIAFYDISYSGTRPGGVVDLTIGNSTWYHADEVKKYELICVGLFENLHPRFKLVSQNTFDSMIEGLGSNQVSVFVNDYAYVDRVIKKYENLGYFAVSPFKLGASAKDEKLEKDRINLLLISLLSSALTLILQLVILKLIFAALKEHYKLLSNIGLRGKTASGSIVLLFVLYTLIAELISLAVILALNHYGYVRVVNIFKYLEVWKIILIYVIHFAFSMLACFFAIRTIKKHVFSMNGAFEDVDGELMEEVMNG